jgi:hypothetical protein
MKHHVPDVIRKNGFACFTSLNEAERAVVMFGEEEYRKSLDLENDDARVLEDTKWRVNYLCWLESYVYPNDGLHSMETKTS